MISPFTRSLKCCLLHRSALGRWAVLLGCMVQLRLEPVALSNASVGSVSVTFLEFIMQTCAPLEFSITNGSRSRISSKLWASDRCINHAIVSWHLSCTECGVSLGKFVR